MTAYSAIIVSTVFFASVVTGITIFSNEFSDRYGIAQGTANFSLINDTRKIEQKTQSIQDEITSITRDFTITDVFDLATLFVFKVGGLLLDMGNVMITTIAKVPQLFTSIPIPTWFTGMLLTLALIFLVFAILGMALKKEV